MRDIRTDNGIHIRTTETDKYLNDIKKYPLLSAEEEPILFERIRKGDREAFETVIKSNLRFVAACAKQFVGCGIPLSDLIAEGNTGLFRAVDHSMVDNWLREHFQLTHDGYTRWNHVDSNNFHNCVGSFNRLDKEPRNVESIDLMTERAIRTNWYPGCKFKQNAILTKVLGDSPRFKAGLSKEWRFWDKDFENWIWAETLADATANFRMLEWYEHRELDEMPAYIQDNFFPVTIPESVNPNYRRIYKVKEHNINEHGDAGCVVDYNGDELFLPYNHCLPSTEEKFNEQ